MAIRTTTTLLAVIGLLATFSTARAQFREERILHNSSVVVDEFMALRARRIPCAMLADAQGIAIIPGMVKAGFVVGGRHGKGVLITRDEAGQWRTPVFITLTGGNIGYQIGVQSTDLILVFKTQASIEGIFDGKMTLGVDAAAAAGPVGRQAAAATDGQLRAEIYSYSRSRGLFAGVSIDGSVLRLADDLNAAYYGGREGALDERDPAVQLLTKVATYSVDRTMQGGAEGFEPQPAEPGFEELPVPTPAGAPTPAGEPTLAPPQNADPSEETRRRLSASVESMSRLLDRSWNEYLALPDEVYHAGGAAPREAIRHALGRYESVAANPEYRALNTRAEFRTTHALLRQYEAAISQQDTALRLPSPPAGESSVIAPRR